MGRELDPNKENVLTAINFGHGLPRALVVPGVPVAAIADLSTYGVLTGISDQEQRAKALDLFARMYAPAVGTGMVTDYLRSTGMEALTGADIVKVAPERYSSNVEYPNSSIAAHLKDIAQVYLAGLGTRIFYTQHGGFDTHAGEMAAHPILWKEASEGVSAFFEDLHAHGQGDNVIMYLFTEFGRRVHDNGSGTDHGAAGAAFLIGDQVQGRHVRPVPLRQGRGPGAGRPGPQLRLPRRLYLHRGGLVRHGRQAHRQRQLRKAGVPVDPATVCWRATQPGPGVA